MGIREVIEMINRMQTDGVIEAYAIGGAVGATFYLEPAATLDVDVFVEFHAEPGSRMVSLEPIFKYLRDHDCSKEGEHIVIAGWPVQFLPARSPLLQEALAAAAEKDVDGTLARVFTAEHIVPLRFKQATPRTKRAFFNSSRQACSNSMAFRKFSRAMV